MMDVMIRRQVRELYRRLKAKAALTGYKVSAAIRDAMKTWLEQSNKSVESKYDANNSTYESMRGSLQEKYRGMYAVFHSGEFLAAAPTLKEDGRMAGERRPKR